MANTCSFYTEFQLLKVCTSKKNIVTKYHQVFYFLFLLVFTSADIIFHKFLELHSTFSEKKDFRHKFSLFKGFTQTPHPLQPKSDKRDGSSLLIPLNMFVFHLLHYMLLLCTWAFWKYDPAPFQEKMTNKKTIQHFQCFGK